MAGADLGGLYVTITGDFSQLQDAINSAVSMAERGGEEIASAFQATDFSGLATSADDVVTALRNVTSAAGDTQLAVEALTDKQAYAREVYNSAVAAYNVLNDSLQNNIALSTGAVASAEDVARAEADVSKAARQAGIDIGSAGKAGAGGFTSMAEAGGELVSTLRDIAAVAGVSVSLGEIGKQAIEAYADIQQANISLTALSGSAQFAADRIDYLKQLSQSDALAFPSLVEAQQKMTAFGFSASESAGLLQNAADAAKATGNSFDQVANSLDRIAESGQISGRFLIQLGLNIKDVADVMGVAQDKVAGLFKEMDVSDRITILSAAMQKFAGIAAESADTVTGHWQQFQNAMSFAFEQIGETIAPAITVLIDDLKDLVGPVSSVGSAFLSVGLNDFNTFIQSLKDTSEAVQSIQGLFFTFSGNSKAASESLREFASDVVNSVFHFRDLATVLEVIAVLEDRMSNSTANADKSMRSALSAGTDLAKQESEAYININGLLDQYAQKQKDAQAAAIAAAVAKAQAALDAKKNMVDLAAAEDSIFTRTETMANTGLDNLIAFGNATKTVQDEFVKLEDQIPHTLQQFQDLAASGVNFNKLEDSVQGFLQKMKDAGLEGSLLYTELEQDNQDLLQYMTDTMYGMDKVGLSFQAAQVKVVDGIAKLIQAEDTFASKKPFDQFSQDLQQLGITVDGVTIKAGKDFAAFDDLTKQNIVTTEELSAGWNKLQKDITAVANDPGGMEKVVSLENDYLSALDRLHAPLQEQLALTVALAQKNLDIAETQGTSATNVLQMGINLEIAKVKQSAFNDQLTGSLNLFNDMTKSISAAWTAFGTGIADAITGSESFGQAMSKVLADMEKKLTELVVNYLLGQLKDAFLQNTNALKDFGETFSSIFGSAGSSSGGGVGGAASGITGGVQQVAGGIQQMGSGIIGVLSQTFSLISSIGTLISSIIQNFQLAHIENVLGEIEQSTRRLDISFEGAGLQYLFNIEAHTGDLIGDFRGWFHDAFASLMSTTEDMDAQLQKIAVMGAAAGSGSGGGNVGSPSFGSSGGSVSGTGTPVDNSVSTGDQTTFSQTGTSTAPSVPISTGSSTASSPAGPNPDTGQLGTPQYSLINGAWVATGVNSGFSSTPAAQQGAALPAGKYATYSAALAAAAGSGNIIVAAPGGGFDVAVENRVTSSDANSNPAGIANLLQNAGFNSNQIALYLANVAAGSGAAALSSVLSSAPSSFTSQAINPRTGLPQDYTGPTPTTGLPSSVLSNQSGSVPTLVINFAGATIYGSNGATQVAQQIFNVARTSGQLRY